MSIEPSLNEADARFVREVREFVGANLPSDIARKVARDQILVKDDYLRWQSVLAAEGWLLNTWSAEDGGPGWSVVQQYLFDTICSEMNCPPIIPFGPRMIGPVLQKFGSPAQRERFLPGIRASTTWWCQGYSEPNAGSDLASLQTRAEDGGDHYRVTGQKIWTSWAHYADWIFCLVRTSREARPQQGITFLLIDMRSPGVEVSPIATLDGTHSFNAVHLTDVIVPKSQRIGEEGAGWTYAKYLLSHERLDTAGIGFAKRLMRKLERIAAGDDYPGTPLVEDPLFIRKLVDAEARLMALELRALHFLGELARGGSPGEAVSALKIRGTELCQDLLELTMEAGGILAVPYQPAQIIGADADAQPLGPAFAATAMARYMNRRSLTILGGTTEVQKNILAKAVLGM